MSEQVAKPDLTTESKLERLFSQGHFVVTSEIGPQKGASAQNIITHTRESRQYCDCLLYTSPSPRD